MTHALNAALDYASKGWASFPLVGKKPGIANAHPKGDPLRGICTGECGKLGHGFHDAVTDRAQLERWFRDESYTNIGVAVPDGHWVLDVDPRNGGDTTWERIVPQLPATTLRFATGGGGTHLWYRGDAPNVRLPGVDIKTGGKGYVVMPPSVHPDTGQPYRLEIKAPVAFFSGPLRFPGSPDTGELLTDVLGGSEYAREAAEGDDAIISGGVDGQHNTLLAVAGHALSLYPVPVARLVYDKALGRCEPEHPESEAERIWHYVLGKQATGYGLVEETVTGQDLPVDGSVQGDPPGGREELKKLTAREWAMRQREEKEAERLPLPTFKSAWKLLEEPEPPLNWRVAEILPIESVAVLHAGAKVGKTHIIGHMVNSLLTGKSFLGQWDVTATDKNVVLVDLELSERVLRSWSEKFDNKSERLRIASLRGNSRAMDIMSDAHFDRVVAAIAAQNPGVLIIDPLGPMLGARGIEENDNGAVRGLLDRLMDLKEQTGAGEMIVSHHAGHSSKNRTRGASVFLDWPDVLIGIRKKNEDDPASPRILSAYGRDVNLPATELSFNPITQSLIVAEHQSDGAVLLGVITRNPGLQMNELRQRLADAGADKSPTTLRREIDALVLSGEIRTEQLPVRGTPNVYFAEGALS